MNIPRRGPLSTRPAGSSYLHAQSLVECFESRVQWLASGMETGADEGYAKLDSLLRDIG